MPPKGNPLLEGGFSDPKTSPQLGQPRGLPRCSGGGPYQRGNGMFDTNHFSFSLAWVFHGPRPVVGAGNRGPPKAAATLCTRTYTTVLRPSNHI
jgi:hypothetical protein